jgi:glycosyltransferase involved in cell wall biosynthesis
VVTIKRGLEGVIVPSKMYGILAAGKPIVAVATRETDVAKIGEHFGFAICADPDNASQLAQKVSQLFRNPEMLRRMSEVARNAANGFDRTSELRKLKQIIEEARST